MPEHPVPHPDAAGYVLGVLEPDEATAFAAHLRTCAACQREVAELGPLRAALDSVLPGPIVPPGLAERTFAAVAAADRSDAPGEPPPVVTVRPTRARRRRGRVAVALAGVAAAVVVTAAAMAWGPDEGGHRVELVAADGGGSHGVATLRRDAEGVAVRLEVNRLDVPPPGSFYECWYVGDGDTAERPARLSAGTFVVGPGGTATVRMTTAADHRRYPRIEVTLEPDDGDPARTGPVVLRSNARR